MLGMSNGDGVVAPVGSRDDLNRCCTGTGRRRLCPPSPTRAAGRGGGKQSEMRRALINVHRWWPWPSFRCPEAEKGRVMDTCRIARGAALRGELGWAVVGRAPCGIKAPTYAG
jgi:hypothetical protein